ncbi:hypothetical protein [Larkinella soli]|uniref:hypothetical protein n=1 Tax=Larkinella soli TaxID=1770527 RepID=UPI000FFBE6AB|nr:hypothetical protein [Larkinella soli]
MKPSLHCWSLLLFLLSAPGGLQAQDSLLIPLPKDLRQAVTLDLGGPVPVFGASYRHRIIRFQSADRRLSGGFELSAGLGVVPTICLFSRCPPTISTHHALLFLYGNRLQGEFGYHGTYVKSYFLFSDVEGYLPGAGIGLRYHTTRRWLFRLSVSGWIYDSRDFGANATGDLVWRKTRYLVFLPGISVGRPF